MKTKQQLKPLCIIILAAAMALAAMPMTSIAGEGFSASPMIAGGAYHTVALKADGTVWAWGSNEHGQSGEGTATGVNPLGHVPVLSGVTSVAAGYVYNIALKQDGTVWTWGSNIYGQLGDGTSGEHSYRSAPGQVPGLSGVTAIAAGGWHALALKQDGTVWVWGLNNDGQLGTGNNMASSSPVQVPGLYGVAAIAGGDHHSLALKQDGTMWAWGANNYGQLGDATTLYRYSPVQVAGLSGVADLAAGSQYTLALKLDGTVWAWGSNENSQIGDSETDINSTPAQIQELSNITAIAAGEYHALALSQDGTVWLWGDQEFHTVSAPHGDMAHNPKPLPEYKPEPVAELSAITDISAGSEHSLALKQDGTVWAWGRNYEGQLGSGETARHRGSPQLVLGENGADFLNLGANPPFLKGDATRDGKINIQDILAIRDHIFGTKPLTGAALIAADITGANKIDIQSILSVRDYIFNSGASE